MTRNYPNKADEIHDKPISDAWKELWSVCPDWNYGHLHGTQLQKEKLSGIPIAAWIRFLKLFSEDKNEAEILSGIDAMAREVGRLPLSPESRETVRIHLAALVEALADTTPPTSVTPPRRSKKTAPPPPSDD